MEIFSWEIVKSIIPVLLSASILGAAYKYRDKEEHHYWNMMFGYPIGFSLFLAASYYIISGSSLSNTLSLFPKAMAVATIIGFIVGAYKLKGHLIENT